MLKTNDRKMWTYEQYYLGEKDDDGRKEGIGENHWSGAYSLEWYTGQFLRNTMHGSGEYRCRHRGRDGLSVSYEGHFYANTMHGYGTMSYPNGQVYNGLFYSNMRWGPGIESQVARREDVGFWRGNQLVRLTWRPPTPSVIPDVLASASGQRDVQPFRIVLSTVTQTIGEVNNAIELLKECGCNAKTATEKWKKLYPKMCTDLNSRACEVEAFDKCYYERNKIKSFKEVNKDYKIEDISDGSTGNFEDKIMFYAWNNSKIIVHMMNHCYKHDHQINRSDINLRLILTGPRKAFKPAGHHEIDCRTLLMASYLGDIANVMRLLNENDLCPDVADIQGNTSIMYAACGMQKDIIHFLVEAGADVDSPNDACCTPLGVALLRFACFRKEIFQSEIVNALLPPLNPTPLSLEDQNIVEWNMSRDLSLSNDYETPTRSASKTGKMGKSSIKEAKKPEGLQNVTTDLNAESVTSINEDTKHYHMIYKKFLIKISELYSNPSAVAPVPYIFEVNDMIKGIDLYEDEIKKTFDKNPKNKTGLPIPVKDNFKPSANELRVKEKDNVSLNSIERKKIKTLDDMMSTILQLLSNGANLNLIKYPRPALFIAIVSGSPELISHLIKHGANANEAYPEALNYTPLHLAVSRTLTFESLESVKVLLENKASTNRRLPYNGHNALETSVHCDGPNLLHVLLARQTDNEYEADILRQIIALLLDYDCDPLMRFRGRSPLDVVMSKDMELFDIFIKNPKTNLNAHINDMNQSILVKLFTFSYFKTLDSTDRQEMLSNLLLFGADPLIECRNIDDRYHNIFVFARKILEAFPSPRQEIKADSKDKKKSKTDIKGFGKSTSKMISDDIIEFKMALDMMTECARTLHIRWIQAKLAKELIEIITKYKHRNWNMILREHKNKNPTGLWLTPKRALEIWFILTTSKPRSQVYKNKKILKHLLCIINFYTLRGRIDYFNPYISSQEKTTIDSNVQQFLRDYNDISIDADGFPWLKSYVKPELAINADEKFKICFECCMPFGNEEILCYWCNMVAFCSLECMKVNVERTRCHPCSDYLKIKYFSGSDSSGY